MAQPQAYNRETDFTERDGDDTNHPGINTELDAAAQSINEIRNNLALIQRDDGALQNGIVTAESLAPTAFDAFKGDLNQAVADAQTAATSANNAAVSANTARDTAVAAKDTAVTSANAAALNATTATTKAAESSASATAAATSATNSATSATSSANSATTATTKAGEASTSATSAATSATAAAASQTAAATSATNAASSATTATTQAGIATTQASNAAASASAAAASLEDFDDRYLGSKTADPTTDNDGNPLITGALYFNSVAGEMLVWAGTFWKATGSSVGGTINTAKYTATAGQTTFAIVYDVGFVHVYLNGLKLESGVEFTANNGTSVILATGAIAGDVVDIIAFGIFSVANTYTKAELNASTGASLVGFQQSGTGSVLRTVDAKIKEFVSVKDFGAVGDGVADDRARFSIAHNSVAAGIPILVPTGSYYFSTNLTVTGRRFVFDGGAIVSGPGRLVGGLVERIDPTSGARSFGVGEPLQFGSYYRFGRNAGGAIGLTVGGGDPADGENGNVLFPDVYSGWTTLMPTQYLSSAEFAVQPASSAGACTTAIGGNTVTRVSGGGFLSEFVGRRIYLGEGSYLVATVNTGAQTLTVTNLNGSAVSFASAGPLTFVVVGVKGTGVCNTSGTTVVRVSGDPFVPLTNTEYVLQINGVNYSVSSVTDFNNIVLSASAGTQTAVSYTFWTSVDDLSSAVRVHRISGAGFEENITIGAYAAGYFHLHAAGGAGRQYPLYIGTGFDTSGAKRKQIALQSSGKLNLGGDAGFCSLEIEGRDGVASNGFSVGGAATGGGTPGLTVIGNDANIGMSLSTKGNGLYKFFSANYAAQQFEIGQLNTGTSWLGVRSDAFDQPRLYAAGAAANIDIQLIPKGTGRVLLGAWTANVDAAVNGYITVKDNAGNLRKLATIA